MSNPSKAYPTSAPASSLPALEESPLIPLDQALRQLGFPAPRLVSGRASVADWFRPAERCGLYVLLFENGECFGGSTSDVVWQYTGHARTEVDIAWLAFRPLAEQAIEQELERLTGVLDGRALRQAMSEMLPRAETDFDLLMPVQEQRRWLSDLGYADHSGRRPVDTALRQKYRRNYERFLRAPFAPQAISALRIYAWQGIPILAPGEISFWSLSCMPTHWVYARVNLNWQETLSAFLQNGQLWFSLHLASSLLEKNFGPGLYKLRQRYPLAVHIDHQFVPGGADQTSFDLPAGIVRSFITDPKILPAIRQFNLRLLRKGPCSSGHYHCLNLADHLLENS